MHIIKKYSNKILLYTSEQKIEVSTILFPSIIWKQRDVEIKNDTC